MFKLLQGISSRSLASTATISSCIIFTDSNIAGTEAQSKSPQKKVKIEKVKASIANLIDEDMKNRNDGTSLVGTFVRLAWHQAGTYDKADDSGGSNGGRIRHNPERNWSANSGLGLAMDKLDKIKEKHPEISYADLYALAGIVAIEEAGGPVIDFKLGRVDEPNGDNSPAEGRLPDADRGTWKGTIQHMRDVFHRLGLTDREMVALLGAHSLGRCHTYNSQYWGPWTLAENTMSNEYFRLLVEERWTEKHTHNGKLWQGPLQYENSTGELMMLPSDMALLHDENLKTYVEMYAKDEEVFFRDFALAFSKLLQLGVPENKSWFQFR